MLLFWRQPDFASVASQVLRFKQLKSEETRKAATRQIGRLIENFGPVPIKKISDDLWNEYVLRERQKKHRTFFDDRKYMRMILIEARRKKLVVEVPRLQIPDLPWDAGREISKEELRRLEAHASSTLRFQIRIGWKMGLRLREMMYLRWSQIDWNQSAVLFWADETKTKYRRVVPIPPDLLAEFCERRALAESEFVFESPTGGKPQDSNKTAWRRCRAKADSEARWHDLRHTCASIMLRRGVPLHVVQRYLGMSEVVLRRIYSHLNDRDLKRAAKVLSLGGKKF